MSSFVTDSNGNAKIVRCAKFVSNGLLVSAIGSNESFAIPPYGTLEICYWEDKSLDELLDNMSRRVHALRVANKNSEDTMRLDKIERMGNWPRWREGDTVREAIDRVGGEWL